MIKRVFDIAVATCAIVVTWPLIVLGGIAMKLTSPGPAFYRSKRAGLRGLAFEMFKLRTMRAGADTTGRKITAAADDRVTSVGRLLRRFKIDELPQFWNVLRGEMSVVGPRPEDWDLVQRHYTPAQRRILDVHPGIVSPVDVHWYPDLTYHDPPPDGVSMQEWYVARHLPTQVAEGLRYIEEQSPWLDLKVITQTIFCVVARSWAVPRKRVPTAERRVVTKRLTPQMPTCVISQPRFFPGLHYLHRMMVTDVFVILDTTQFNPRHEENRAKVKGAAGPQWLTVPVRQARRDQPITEIRPDDTQSWQRRLIGTLNSLYGPAPFFKTHAPEIVSILEAPHETLTQLNRASWEPALRRLGITCRFVLSSELPPFGKGSEQLLQICAHLGASVYLSGASAKGYLDVAAFGAAGIEVRYHEYQYPTYPQRHGDFVPFLSYLDMLFNAGLNRDTILAAGRALPAG